ncbi:MAG: hypothetical protein ACLPWF_24215 [Bryobacteraceae bacterium]
MNRMLRIGCLLAATCALILAQPPTGAMKMGQGMKMTRYDISTETTITGTVQDVLQPHMGRMMGTHLIVKTATETIEVHVGPSNFVASEGFTFAKGESVQILGSRVTIDGKEALISREVTKDGKTLTLRDKTGRPLWAGRKS